jgi:hypothetical protein
MSMRLTQGICVCKKTNPTRARTSSNTKQVRQADEADGLAIGVPAMTAYIFAAAIIRTNT